MATLERKVRDDKVKRGAPHPARINLSQDYEVRDWANIFGVDEHELRNAVSSVGDSADKVREYLRNRMQRKGPYRAGYLRQQKRHNWTNVRANQEKKHGTQREPQDH